MWSRIKAIGKKFRYMKVNFRFLFRGLSLSVDSHAGFTHDRYIDLFTVC